MSLHPGIWREASQAQSEKANSVSSKKGLQDQACKPSLGSLKYLKFPQTCQLDSEESPNLLAQRRSFGPCNLDSLVIILPFP